MWKNITNPWNAWICFVMLQIIPLQKRKGNWMLFWVLCWIISCWKICYASLFFFDAFMVWFHLTFNLREPSLEKITRRTTGAQGCKFLTSFERFWRVLNFIEPIFRSTLIYLNLFRSITFFLGLSIAIWLSLAIMGYLRLSRSISCYLGISFAISGYFWLSSVIFGNFLLFLAKSCYIRLYQAI